MKRVMAINQKRSNTTSDNRQQVGDFKYYHLQDAWKDWSGGKRLVCLVPVYYISFKSPNQKKYSTLNSQVHLKMIKLNLYLFNMSV